MIGRSVRRVLVWMIRAYQFAISPMFGQTCRYYPSCSTYALQAIEAGKLFHIDLNDQKFGRFDQDLRFGSESLKSLFFVVKLLEESGYDGPRHFDAHAYRSEDPEGVWDFARGCIRTYQALAEKAAHFDSLPEVQQALAHAGATGLSEPSTSTEDSAETLKAEGLELDALAARGYGNELLDQLVVDVLLGLR